MSTPEQVIKDLKKKVEELTKSNAVKEEKLKWLSSENNGK